MSIRTTASKRPWKSLLLLTWLVIGACATEPAPRPVTLDPSNPQAPESPPLSVGALNPPLAPATKPRFDKDAAEPGMTIYTCPMHPEVISGKPGSCPKCGMTLVPRPPETKP